MEVKVDVTDYTQRWVVYKKMKGTPYFYRGGRYTTTSKNCSDALLFDKKEDAVASAATMTAKKTGYRFRVEVASKYFVNSFQFQVQNYYSDSPMAFTITSKKISVPNAIKYKSHILDLNSKREELVKSLDANKAATIQSIAQRRNELKSKELEVAKQISSYETKIKELDEALEVAKTEDFNKLIEPYISNTDRNVAVLFGKKEQPKTTLHNQGSMLLLPLKT